MGLHLCVGAVALVAFTPQRPRLVGDGGRSRRQHLCRPALSLLRVLRLRIPALGYYGYRPYGYYGYRRYNGPRYRYWGRRALVTTKCRAAESKATEKARPTGGRADKIARA